MRWDGRYDSDTDPKFADISRHDYRLTKESPMLGAGTLVQDHIIMRDGKEIVIKAFNETCNGVVSIGAHQTPVAEASIPGTNIAAGKPVTASSSMENAAEGFGAAKLTDGVINSEKGVSLGWRSNASKDRQHKEWVQIDLGAPAAFARVDMYPRNDGPAEKWGWDRGHIGRGVPAKLTLLASNDPQFQTGVSILAVDDNVYERPHVWTYDFQRVTARYVRIVGDELIGYPYEKDKTNREFMMQFAEVQIFAGKEASDRQGP